MGKEGIVRLNEKPLEAGSLAPAFELVSSKGEPFTREQFRGKSALALIFFQDTPAARQLLTEVDKDAHEYEELNARPFGIGRATADQLEPIGKALKLSFPLLADPDGKTWQAFTKSDTPGYAVFVLDLYGGVDSQKVVAVEEEMPTAATILEWVRGAQYRCNI